MTMFWNKIPKGYVETVDGYLIKESEAKKVIEYRDVVYYRKEVAPKYDREESKKVGISFGYPTYCQAFYRDEVEVSEDGTPIGYHTQEEVQSLKDRIKELEDKCYCCEEYESYTPEFFESAYKKAVEDYYNGFKPKNKRGRPKKK